MRSYCPTSHFPQIWFIFSKSRFSLYVLHAAWTHPQHQANLNFIRLSKPWPPQTSFRPAHPPTCPLCPHTAARSSTPRPSFHAAVVTGSSSFAPNGNDLLLPPRHSAPPLPPRPSSRCSRRLFCSCAPRCCCFFPHRLAAQRFVVGFYSAPKGSAALPLALSKHTGHRAALE